MKVLVVGGAGGGGSGNAGHGGGGAGGFQYDADFEVEIGSYAITVGAGGAGSVNSDPGSDGIDSIFSTITGEGGGGGGGYNASGIGRDGGSGGGSSYEGTGGAGTVGQGYDGGEAHSYATAYGGGGGGGSSAVGANANSGNGNGGVGGAGTANSISGSAVTYGGGGGGGTRGGTAGGGGAGGGGAGSNTSSTAGVGGTANLGGGGGGGGDNVPGNASDGGAGGSGVVIIRYATASTGSAYGGTITTDGADTVHTFNSTGTFTYIGQTLPANGDFPQSGSIVSRWKLDEASGSRADSVGSNTLTDNNTVLASTTPQFGANAADFEAGNSEYLSVADNASLSITGDLSFSAWVKFESGAGSAYRIIMSKWESGESGRRAYFLRTSASNQIEFAYSSDGSTTDGYELVAWTPVDGVWYHMAVVYDASAGEVDFYINGAQQGATQTGGPTSIHDGTGALWLGREATRNMDGLIQDAVLWNAELTAADIEDLYNAYFNLPDEGDLPQSASVVSRWTLTEDGGTRNDQVGTNHLTDTNTVLSGVGIAEVATAERGADFEASNTEYLSITDASQSGLDITGDFSVSFWMKHEGLATTIGLFSKYNTTGGNRSYTFYYQGGNQRFIAIIDSLGDGTTGEDLYIHDATMVADVWYHVTWTWDASASSSQIYFNGAAEGSAQTGDDTSIYNGTAAFELGSNTAGGSNPFDGLMQDFIVWDGVELSDAEVTDLYELYTVVPSTGVPNSLMMMGVGT